MDNTTNPPTSSTTVEFKASERQRIKAEDWAMVGRDFKSTGNDIWASILAFHASNCNSPTEGQEE